MESQQLMKGMLKESRFPWKTGWINQDGMYLWSVCCHPSFLLPSVLLFLQSITSIYCTWPKALRASRPEEPEWKDIKWLFAGCAGIKVKFIQLNFGWDGMFRGGAVMYNTDSSGSLNTDWNLLYPTDQTKSWICYSSTGNFFALVALFTLDILVFFSAIEFNRFLFYFSFSFAFGYVRSTDKQIIVHFYTLTHRFIKCS